MTKLIIFDLDGVIADSTKLVSEYFLKIYPTLTVESSTALLNGNFHEELEKFKLTNKPIEETEEEKKIRQETYSKEKAKVSLYAGIRELLEELKRAGCVLTINTSATEVNCTPLLENSKIKDLFDFLGTAEVSKSKVEKFKIIEDKFKIPRENSIFITDTLGDLREAATAGIKTIAVTWGAHTKETFTREKFDNLVAVVDTVGELKDYILS